LETATAYSIHTYQDIATRATPFSARTNASTPCLACRPAVEAMGGKQELWNTEAGALRTYRTYADGRPWTPEKVRAERRITGSPARWIGTARSGRRAYEPEGLRKAIVRVVPACLARQGGRRASLFDDTVSPLPGRRKGHKTIAAAEAFAEKDPKKTCRAP